MKKTSGFGKENLRLGIPSITSGTNSGNTKMHNIMNEKGVECCWNKIVTIRDKASGKLKFCDSYCFKY